MTPICPADATHEFPDGRAVQRLCLKAVPKRPMPTNYSIDDFKLPTVASPLKNDEEGAAFLLELIRKMCAKKSDRPVVEDGWLRCHFVGCLSGIGDKRKKVL